MPTVEEGPRDRKNVIFTERELDVMAVLWDLESGTVGEVRELLPVELAYTTVLTILRTLEAKGHVGHRLEGRAHRYLPLVGRAEAQDSAVERVRRRLFAGSTQLLLTHLVSDRELGVAELAKLRALLDERMQS
jgi:BlaI family transcriptional regulator, penicillinase repressor